ncbi:MAG: DNA-processing protein DprA [Raoultibacter sp.]|jgi:DNA processing protein
MLSGTRVVIEQNEDLFPQALRTIPRPPEKLYLIGNPAALQEGLAIIGARKATPYGIACAQRFAKCAARKGIVIISGGALGCDAAAHRAALEENGRTIAFLGGGCDKIYPVANKSLFQRIVDKGGAVVSEYDWSHPPMKYGFRARNRLIAGLARATLIVEAGLPSGTFSTADEALEANREVLVVPGSIASKTSHGANRLLYQGATPIVDDESFEDVLFSLFGVLKQEEYAASGVATGSLSSSQKKVYDALSAQSLRVDELKDVLQTESEIVKDHSIVMQILIELEVSGLIARYPDGRYGVANF